ncbi:MFS transporter [Aureimonas altamirensis]|uniref:MFS transporter n=1 Tax=Aureimonas altamirensis TaxID=370622 RepID=UPI0030193717
MTNATPSKTNRLPLIALLALATTAFLTILTETMPAAVLLDMGSGLGQPPAAVGLLVSVYALASAAAAIPVVALTGHIPRRQLYVVLLVSFAQFNAITAFSTSYALTLVSRIGAGLTAGVAWPVVVGFAIRLGQGKDVGRAVAITLAGSTVAMVAGLPLGSFLGSVFGWRTTYALLSVIALAVTLWALAVIPPTPGERSHDAPSVGSVARLSGLWLILLATLFGILAHYTLYTYVEPLSQSLRLPGATTQGLLLFGGGALLGIVAVGRFVDARLLLLAIMAPVLALLALVTLLLTDTPLVAEAALIIWGVSFGGLPTIFQSAVARVAADRTAELATAMLTTVYNVGIFAGGAVGGLLITYREISSLIGFAMLSILITLALILKGRDSVFSD